MRDGGALLGARDGVSDAVVLACPVGRLIAGAHLR